MINEHNLRRLAVYLRALPEGYEHFDMKRYRSDYEAASAKPLGCGTVACAVGHAPFALPDCPILPGMTWGGYSSAYLTDERDAWRWCFNYWWVDTDNTAKGAADRIDWLLNRGLPKDWNEQMWGHAPLCYREAVQ